MLGGSVVLMPGVDEETARRALTELATTVAGTRFVVADENVRLLLRGGSSQRLTQPRTAWNTRPRRTGSVIRAVISA
ncbi:hypothetical protein [Streptomyces chartreusis]